jgi:hypothetical protein
MSSLWAGGWYFGGDSSARYANGSVSVCLHIPAITYKEDRLSPMLHWVVRLAIAFPRFSAAVVLVERTEGCGFANTLLDLSPGPATSHSIRRFQRLTY